MSAKLLFGLLALALWTSWLCFAQGALVALGWPSALLPDLVLVLAIVLSARASEGRALAALFVIALVRAAFGVEGPLAVLAAFLAAGLALEWLRRWFDFRDPFLCASSAFALSLLLGAWWRVVSAGRVWRAGIAVDWGFTPLLGAAAVTAVAALALAPLLARLPGLRGLWRRAA
ncbi:MAG: hypothetical protein FJ299_07875 [Planctomycetes bacterium]|nr:hypothetical protein [Planctomycetota bacterium]